MATVTKYLTRDLCPRKPDPHLLDVGQTSVTVTVTLDTKKPPPSSKVDRVVKAGDEVLATYQKTISEEVAKLEAKIRDAKAKRNFTEMARMAADTTTSVQGACRAIQGAVNDAVARRLKTEAQGDQNLLEARIIVGVKAAFKVITIAKDATEVALTGGTDVHALYSLVKDIASLASLIYDACKGEAKLRQELLNAIGAMTTDRQRQLIDHQMADRSTLKKVKAMAKDVYRWYKPKADAAESSRKKYRNEVTKMRQNVDSLFTKIDKMQTALRSAQTLKEGVAIGAKMMEMKRSGAVVKERFNKAEEFSNDMAFLMQEAGVDVDDRTITEKIASLSNLGDVVKAGMEIKSAAMDAKDLVENVIKLAS